MPDFELIDRPVDNFPGTKTLTDILVDYYLTVLAEAEKRLDRLNEQYERGEIDRDAYYVLDELFTDVADNFRAQLTALGQHQPDRIR